MVADIQKLQRQLNYTFEDESFLLLALHHRSMGKENNERLEFLGDSIVNCIVASALFEQQPESDEGGLSRLRSSLVKGDTLAEIAREFSLGDYLYLGPGEMKSGGFKRNSILAGTLEAVIGAMYLDSDFLIVQKTVLGWYEQRLQNLGAVEQHKDAKTALQEWLQARKIPVPVYSMLKTTGAAHNQVFHVRCRVERMDAETTAEGSSRRKAEQNAAAKFLEAVKNDK